jgi:ribosome-binding factor A
MSSRRTAKVAEAIRECVSSTVLFAVRDPRVKNVTVLRAEVADDLRTAKVYVSVRGEAKEASLALHGLNSARGFIQAKLADRLQTRYTPVLTFKIDDEVKKLAAASALIDQVLAADRAASGAESLNDEAVNRVESDKADVGPSDDGED